MNHFKQYQSLINKAKNRTFEDDIYVEKHHIIPKSLGGSNSKDNIVLLTAREHFIAHLLLAKIYGGGMWQAVIMMKHSPKNVRCINSRMFEVAKVAWSNYLKGKRRPAHVIEAIKIAQTGKKASESTKAKMSEVRKGKSRAGNPDNWKHSAESREKMSKSRIGLSNHMQSTEHRERMKKENPMKSAEARLKVSNAKKLYWERKKNETN